MGFFNFMDVDAPQRDIPDKKRGPAGTYLNLYWNKLGKAIVMNLIFFVANIPALAVVYVATIFTLPFINENLSPAGIQELVAQLGVSVAAQTDPGKDVTTQIYVSVVIFVALFIVGMTLICVGPVQSALSYVYRNLVARKPTMLWSDFITSLKRDWKQSLGASAISLVLTAVVVFNIGFYNTLENNTFTEILFSIFSILFLFLLCVQIYVYPLIASVNLKLTQVYRNAALLFVARFPQTIGIVVIDIVILGLIPGIMIFSFTGIGLILAVIFYGFFAFSLVHLLNTFFVWRQVERFILSKSEALASDDVSQTENEEGSVESPENESEDISTESPENETGDSSVTTAEQSDD